MNDPWCAFPSHELSPLLALNCDDTLCNALRWTLVRRNKSCSKTFCSMTDILLLSIIRRFFSDKMYKRYIGSSFVHPNCNSRWFLNKIRFLCSKCTVMRSVWLSFARFKRKKLLKGQEISEESSCILNSYKKRRKKTQFFLFNHFLKARTEIEKIASEIIWPLERKKKPVEERRYSTAHWRKESSKTICTEESSLPW